jgi:long-subunit acyl-CoA synthetase (AMP-forming)
MWVNGTMHNIVIRSEHHAWSSSDLENQIKEISTVLTERKHPNAPIGLLGNNSPHWIACDLAAQSIAPVIPIPLFFSPEQMAHTVKSSGLGSLLTSNSILADSMGFNFSGHRFGELFLFNVSNYDRAIDKSYQGVDKVTFTSGTTSNPKGVCLSSTQQWQVAETLKDVLKPLAIKKHLNLLPLAVLLENLAGVYTSILSDAENICLPLYEVGFEGSSQFNPHKCLSTIEHYQAESIILLPQMLQAITSVLKRNDSRIKSLKFVAVGGAKTPASLTKRAMDLGLPVYEGYGLSECSSVVALNLPNGQKVGSVGKPLPNRQVRIAKDGEIEVKGQDPVHYFGQTIAADEWLKTGDIGHQDGEGYLYIDGRKKNILITSFGRNVSPEWPESLLMESGLVKQVIVVGDGKPFLSALIVPLSEQISNQKIDALISKINLNLPDYASVKRWLKVTDEFSPLNDLATPNGRLKREAILDKYCADIESLYEV